MHELRPAFPLFGDFRQNAAPGVSRYIKERRFQEMRDEARVGAVIHDRGGAVGIFLFKIQKLLALGVVGALGDREGGIGREAGPALRGGIDIENAVLLAPDNEIRRRDID